MMLVIKNNAARQVTADSENPNYPAVNLLDEHPKRAWRAVDSSVSSATLTVSVAGRTGGLGLVGIVADNAAVTITDPNAINWQNVDWQNIDWVTVPPPLNLQYELKDGTLWVSFEQFEGAVAISITLYKDAGAPEVLSAGCLVVGEMDKFPGLQHPFSEDLVDYSLSRELANGASWYKKRDIVRKFSGTMVAERQTSFRTFMADIARKYGKRPMMWNLVDCYGMEFVVYGRLSVMPAGRHITAARSAIDFEILEVL